MVIYVSDDTVWKTGRSRSARKWPAGPNNPHQICSIGGCVLKSGVANSMAVAIMAVAISATLDSVARADSLVGALAAAYNNNPQLNAQRAATRATDENVAVARSGNRPIVSAEGGLGVTSVRRRTSPMVSTGSTLDALVELVITQNIFRGFRTRSAIQGATAGVYASRELLRNTVQNVLFDAAESYMNVLRDEAILGLRRRNVVFLKEQLRAEQDRFEVGENTRTDVAQTSARLALGESQVSLAIANLSASKAAYRQIVGREPGKLAPGFSFKGLIPSSQKAAEQIAQREHPVIGTAIFSVDVAAFAVKEIEGEMLPTVSLEGSAGTRFDGFSSSYANSATVAGRVSVPIYQGGAVAARVRQAKEIHSQRRIELDLARDQIRAVVISAWGTVIAARAAIVSQTEEVNAAQIALDGVQEEQKVGQRTTLDVLNQQQTLLDAQVNLVLAQRESVVASFALISSMGRLNENRLALRVDRYLPEDHFEAVQNKWRGTRTPDGR